MSIVVIAVVAVICFIISLCCNIHQASEIKRLKSEILKFQLNPHTIKNLMQELLDDMEKVHNDVKSAHENMQEVMELLKEITYRGDDAGTLITVKEEIEQTKRYIDVVKRFKIKEGLNNIVYETADVDVHSKYYENKVIPELVVLPLIENAFMHGDRTADDFLNVHYVLKDEFFEVVVRNREIVNQGENKSEYSGLGLKNLKERLDLLIGEGLYFIESKESEGYYSVKLTINF